MFALITGIATGFPTGTSRNDFPMSYPSSPHPVSSSPSYSGSESHSFNVPNVNGPNVGRWAGRAGRAIGRALR